MNERSSDDDKPANQLMPDRATARPQPLRRRGRTKGDVLPRKAVRDSDTVFGGDLLGDVSQHLQQHPLPLTKRQLAEKYAPDVEQVLAAYPKVTIKEIIAILAKRDRSATGATFERSVAAVLKKRKMATQPETQGVRDKLARACRSPDATGAPEHRPPETDPALNPAPMPPTCGNDSSAASPVEAAPGLFGDDLSGTR